MTDTTPTPADRPADQLRAAAECAPGPELARLLTTLADASDHHGPGEGGVVATVVHPALAVARHLLGTTEGEGADTDAQGVPYWQEKLRAVTEGRDHLKQENDRLRKELAQSERIRENADFHLGQEMARRQLAEKAAAAPPAPADRAATSSPTVLAELVGTIRDLQALQQPLVDALSHIREDMHRARRCGDEWAMEWMSDVWAELPLPVRAAGGDEDAAHELAAAGVQPPTSEADRPGRCPVMIPGVGRCEQNADHPAPHTPEPAAPAAPEEPQ